MILSIYFYYEETSHQDGAVKQLIEKPETFNVGVQETFRKMRFSEDEVRAFFRQNAIDIDGLTEECKTVRSKSLLMQQYDFTAFRTYPLVYTRNEKDFATLIDHSFLTEKISTGVYYNIKLPLEQVANRAIADGDNEAGEAGQSGGTRSPPFLWVLGSPSSTRMRTIGWVMLGLGD